MTKTTKLLLGCACGLALFAAACSWGTSAPTTNNASTANAAKSDYGGAGNGGAGAAQLDAEIARLEEMAEKNPDDETARHDAAEAYVRRAKNAQSAGQLEAALRDYQNALRFDPDHEDAQLGVQLITHEAGTEPLGDDGKPVTVPAKPDKQ